MSRCSLCGVLITVAVSSLYGADAYGAAASEASGVTARHVKMIGMGDTVYAAVRRCVYTHEGVKQCDPYCQDILRAVAVSSKQMSVAMVLVGGEFSFGMVPDVDVCGDMVYWGGVDVTRDVVPFFGRRVSDNTSPAETLPIRPDLPLPEGGAVNAALPWPRSLYPVGVMLWGMGDRSRLEYAFSVHDETVAVWVYQGSLLSQWRYNPKKPLAPLKEGAISMFHLDRDGIPDDLERWDKCGIYPIEFRGGFRVIPAKEPLVLTDGGSLFRLADNKASLIAEIRPVVPGKDEAKPGATMPAASQPAGGVRFVLLELQDQSKYALCQWNGAQLTAVDVQDRTKQNVVPFLPACEVKPEVVKAAAIMMSQLERDEKDVAALKKKQEEERKAKATEDARKPRPQTLQQRLQQN